jgi:hypothetical protein
VGVVRFAIERVADIHVRMKSQPATATTPARDTHIIPRATGTFVLLVKN